MKVGPSASVMITAALLMALSGCQKQEGPAEKAGKQIDQATERAGEKIDKAGEKVGQEVEKVGEKIQDAARRDKK